MVNFSSLKYLLCYEAIKIVVNRDDNLSIKLSKVSSLDFMMVSKVDLSVVNHCLQVMVSTAFFFKSIFKNLFHFQWARTFLALTKEVAL
jgi:hypothetical protein